MPRRAGTSCAPQQDHTCRGSSRGRSGQRGASAACHIVAARAASAQRTKVQTLGGRSGVARSTPVGSAGAQAHGRGSCASAYPPQPPWRDRDDSANALRPRRRLRRGHAPAHPAACRRRRRRDPLPDAVPGPRDGPGRGLLARGPRHRPHRVVAARQPHHGRPARLQPRAGRGRADRRPRPRCADRRRDRRPGAQPGRRAAPARRPRARALRRVWHPHVRVQLVHRERGPAEPAAQQVPHVLAPRGRPRARRPADLGELLRADSVQLLQRHGRDLRRRRAVRRVRRVPARHAGAGQVR